MCNSRQVKQDPGDKDLLVNQTETAIECFIQDDAAHNLPLITTLEDISYKFFVEANDDFLEEEKTLSDEESSSDVSLQWDDEHLFHRKTLAADVSSDCSRQTCMSRNLSYSSFADELDVTSDRQRTSSFIGSCSTCDSGIEPGWDLECKKCGRNNTTVGKISHTTDLHKLMFVILVLSLGFLRDILHGFLDGFLDDHLPFATKNFLLKSNNNSVRRQRKARPSKYSSVDQTYCSHSKAISSLHTGTEVLAM